jgi:uncharacterized protein (TIGR03435 family)
MAGRGELSTRVRAVLNTRQQRGPAGTGVRIAMTIAALGSVALLAPLRTVVGALGQTPTVHPQFEVASVKPSFSDSMMNVRPLPGRLTADATLQVLMQYAYGLQPFQITGGPGWLASARYEIEASAGAAANREQLLLMLQPLLEERFRLKTHREVKELPVYTLVSNRGGIKLPAPKEDACAESASDAALEWAGGRMAVPGELPAARIRCGSALVALTGRLPDARMQLLGGKIAMPEFVRMLSMTLGRVVIDRTGFTAPFDVQLDFAPDETTPSLPPPPPGSPPTSAVSIAQALQQQLGLRLESARGPVEVLVVDQAEPPSPN